MENPNASILDAYIAKMGIKRTRNSYWSRVGAVAREGGTLEYYMATFGYSYIYVDVLNGEPIGLMID